MSDLSGKKIAVLMGGPGSERLVSLASGAGVAKALREAGAEVFEVDVQGASFELPADTTVAFNIIHGTFGEDGQLQEILEKRGVPYTGEGVQGSKLAFDKILSKRRFAERGVATAEFEIVGRDARPTLPVPYVVKAPRQGSSVGVAIVKQPEAASAALAECRQYDAELLVEKFIAGRELTVGVLGDQALPIIEIRAKERFYDFKNKYPFLNPSGGGGADHICPASLETETTRMVQNLALQAHRALDLQVYSRVDVLLSPENEAFVLEINTIPGMTPASLLPEAAAAAGIGYSELCMRIISLSLAARKT